MFRISAVQCSKETMEITDRMTDEEVRCQNLSRKFATGKHLLEFINIMNVLDLSVYSLTLNLFLRLSQDIIF